MIDVGTLGATPSQKALNDILIKLGDKKLTNLLMSRFLRAKRDLAKLKKYILSQDVEFYDQMLEMIRRWHMGWVKEIPKESCPKDAYTHFCCVMTGLFRQAKREIKEAVTENIRRTQKGMQPL